VAKRAAGSLVLCLILLEALFVWSLGGTFRSHEQAVYLEAARRWPLLGNKVSKCLGAKK